MADRFYKYAQRGAYHWGFVSSHPLRHHCPTTARYRAVLAAVSDWKGQDVVDVGCGDGALAGWLVKAGARVTGVEPEADGRGLAKATFKKHGQPGTYVAQTMDLPAGGFDIAVCSDVIEHVSDPLALLGEISRLLKPGGRLVVTTPIRLTEIPLDPHHDQEFFPSEFQSLVETIFNDVTLTKHIPMPGLMLYYWRPWFFLRRPLITWLCNLMEIVFDVNPVEGINALDRYHQLQVIRAIKAV